MLEPHDPHHHDHDRKKPGPLSGLRASFLTGLVVVAPIALTILLLWNIFPARGGLNSISGSTCAAWA